MQIAHCGEHSSRRHHYQQQLRAQRNNNENGSDIDGTAHRVASVTLESDSLSADQPMSFRSKRRKKIPRKEKPQQDIMDVDGCQQRKQLKQSSGEGDEMIQGPHHQLNAIPACKVMEWEEPDNLPSTSSGKLQHSASDLEKNQSDLLSELSDATSTSNADADDEQSDWPEFTDPRKTSIRAHGPLLQPEPTPSGDAALSSATIKQLKQFLQEPSHKELLLDQVYRTSAIKQILREQTISVQIVKKGRGTVALKKV